MLELLSSASCRELHLEADVASQIELADLMALLNFFVFGVREIYANN